MKEKLICFGMLLLAVSNIAFSTTKETVAYVNQGGNCSVAIIDLKTHQVMDTIPIDPSNKKSCILESVVTPKHDMLYAIKAHEHGVDQYMYVYDIQKHALVSSILFPQEPLRLPLANIIMNQDGSHVYVSSYGSSFSDTVWDINTKTLKPRAIRMGVRSSPIEMLMSPEGHRLYVATRGEYSINVIDTSNNAVIGKMNQVDGAKMMLSRDGKILYANWENILWAFDTATYQILWQKQLPVATGLSIAISADNKTFYTSPNYPAKLIGLFAINLETSVLTNLNSIKDELWGIATTQDGKMIYVSDYESGELLAMDAETGEVKVRVSGLDKPEALYLS